LGTAAAVYYLLPDEPPPPDDDLRHFRREVPQSANGFIVLNMDEDEVFWPEDSEGVQAWSKDFDIQEAPEVGEKNALVFEKLEESSRYSDFQVPETTSSEDRAPYLLTWRQIAYVVSCRNRLHLESGKDKESLEGAIELVQLGGRIKESQGPLLSY